LLTLYITPGCPWIHAQYSRYAVEIGFYQEMYWFYTSIITRGISVVCRRGTGFHRRAKHLEQLNFFKRI